MEKKELHRQIKIDVEECYKEIKDANEMLDKLRDDCHHPETELVTYSTRPGQYWEGTEVCSICGEVIKWPYEGMEVPITFTKDSSDAWSCDDCGNSVYNCKCDPA